MDKKETAYTKDFTLYELLKKIINECVHIHTKPENQIYADNNAALCQKLSLN